MSSISQGWEAIQGFNGTPSPGGQRIIVNGDDWTSSDTAFTLDTASHTNYFLQGIEWLTGLSTGANVGRGVLLAPTTMIAALTTQGHTVSSQLTMSADYATQLALLQGYDCVLVHPQGATQLGNSTAWIDYIAAGGSAWFFCGNFSAHTQTNLVVGTYNLNVYLPYVSTSPSVLTDYSGHGHAVLSGVGGLYFLSSHQVAEIGADVKTTIFTGVHPTEGNLDMVGVYDGQL